MPTATHTYTPRGVLRDLFACRANEVLVAGPAGTGKSMACLEKLHLAALNNPGMRALIVRKTLASLGSTALVTWRSRVVGEALDAGAVTFYGGSPQESPQYRYSNGSCIVVGGMDRSIRIMSSEYDCLVGEVLVDSPSPIERCYSRPYSGKLVTITTAHGYQITGTPNHPILTDRGWVSLGKLRQGDNVISRVRSEPLPAHPNPDVANQPTPISQIARSLTLAARGTGRAERVETVPMDFHGDGSYGYVDVVATARLLQDRSRAALDDPVPQPQGAGRHLEQPELMGDGTSIKTLGRGNSASLALSTAPELAHPLAVGRRPPPSQRGALPPFGELALPFRVGAHPFLTVGQGVGGGLPRDAARRHLSLEPGDANVYGERHLRQPPVGEVSPDRIVEVSVADAGWGRHVYNLQTEASWYYADNIVSHNCVYVQEATELVEDDWEALTTRLRHGVMSFQQLIADCNPAQPTHWLKARVDRGVTVMLDSRHEDNPVLFDEDGKLTEVGRAYIGKLDALTGVRHLRLRRGLWAAAEGIIYEEYDPAIHLVDKFKIPDTWTRWWSVDFGYVNPMVIQHWAEDPDGRLILYRELYRTKRTVDQHAVDILAACTRKDHRYTHPLGQPRFAHHGRIWTEPKPRAVVCDHDAEGRAVLQRELGLSTVAAKKTVSDGIQAVQQRLRPAGDGRARLYLCRDAVISRDEDLADAKKPTSTVEEILGYVWDTGLGKKPKEQPLKQDDHGMDAARYVVAERDMGLRPRVRWLG